MEESQELIAEESVLTDTVKEALKEEGIKLFYNLQIKCIADGPLKLDLSVEDILAKHETVEDFVEQFVLDYNYDYATYDLQDNIQCTKNKNRSLEDIYRIALYYYPEATILQVAKRLINPVDELLQSTYCLHIWKIVFTSKNYRSYVAPFTRRLADEITQLNSYMDKLKDKLRYIHYDAVLN